MKHFYLAFFALISCLNAMAFPGPIIGANHLCTGTSMTLSNDSVGGTWSSSNVGVAQIGYTNGIVSGIAPGFANITYTLGGSTAITTIYVNPHAFPLVGSSSVCQGDSLRFTDSIAGGVWSTFNGNASVVAGMVKGISAGVDTVYYSVAYTCGIAKSKKLITINALPAAGTISGSASICANAVTTLTSTVSGGSWSGNNNAVAYVANATGVVTGRAGGNVNVSYTVVSPASCVSRATFPISVTALPVVGAVTGAVAVCQGSAITLADTTVAGVWSCFNTKASVTSGGVVTGNSLGIDTVYYTKTTGCGSFSSKKTITVHPLPHVSPIMYAVDSVCTGAALTLTDSVAGGVWSKSNNYASMYPSGIVKGITAGVDTMMYTFTSPYGCGSASASKEIKVLPQPTTSAISGSYVICAGSMTTLTDVAVGGVWSSAHNTICRVDAAGVVTALAAGTDSIRYTVSNSCGTAQSAKVVSVYARPDAGVFLNGDTIVCVGATITLIDTTIGGVWTRTNSHMTIPGPGALKGNSPGLDTVRYIMASTHGCGSDTVMRVMHVTALPNSGTITGPSIICIGETVTLHETVSTGFWTSTQGVVVMDATGAVTMFGTGKDTVLYVSQTIGCGSDTTKHPIIVQTAGDCRAAVASVELAQNELKVYPNPNADGTLNIEAGANAQQGTLVICNVMGQKLIQQPVNLPAASVSIASLSRGLYVVTLLNADGTVNGVVRLVKE